MKQTLYILIALGLCSLNGMANPSGPITSGGGDAYAGEFTTMAASVYQLLVKKPDPKIDLKVLRDAVEQTRVTTQDALMLNGKEVDAINHPSERLIELSRARWDAISGDSKKRFLLVLHEYLSVAGLADSHYEISSAHFGETAPAVAEYACTGLEDWAALNAQLRLSVFTSEQPENISDQAFVATVYDTKRKQAMESSSASFSFDDDGQIENSDHPEAVLKHIFMLINVNLFSIQSKVYEVPLLPLLQGKEKVDITVRPVRLHEQAAPAIQAVCVKI